jgi:hypothetical protein
MSRVARAFAGVALAHLVTAAVVALGVYELPARVVGVDGAAALLVLGLGVSGAGLLLGARWAVRLAKVVSWTTLVLGLALTAVLALTASHVAGLYGPIGRGGAAILAMVAALAVPYLVVAPALCVRALSRRRAC